MTSAGTRKINCGSNTADALMNIYTILPLVMWFAIPVWLATAFLVAIYHTCRPFATLKRIQKAATLTFLISIDRIFPLPFIGTE